MNMAAAWSRACVRVAGCKTSVSQLAAKVGMSCTVPGLLCTSPTAVLGRSTTAVTEGRAPCSKCCGGCRYPAGCIVSVPVRFSLAMAVPTARIAETTDSNISLYQP